MAALLAGNRERHDELVAEAGVALARCNAIMATGAGSQAGFAQAAQQVFG